MTEFIVGNVYRTYDGDIVRLKEIDREVGRFEVIKSRYYRTDRLCNHLLVRRLFTHLPVYDSPLYKVLNS